MTHIPTMDIGEKLDRLLRRVEKPGRYIGGETNQVVKDPAAVRASIALAFPDVYDIGMSYHGFKILYERINDVARWVAERTFAPWPDMEAKMRAEGVPLFTLETKRPAKDFDLVGFSLQHEVNYTNILNMIDLAGLPVESRDRPDPLPLLIGGGEGALSPEPMAAFFDLFVFGDGEEPLHALMALVEHFKSSGGDKRALLRQAAGISGVYVPAFYEVEYREDETLKRFFPVDGSDSTEAVWILKSIYDLRQDLGPTRPIVPNLRVVHDRLAVEIKRGCTRGCRFCSAGMITRPVRERTPDQILEIAERGIERTGFDEIALLSLSSADYSCILPAVRLLRRAFDDRRVSIALPSLRINAFDVSLAEEIAQVRKTGFTFAPEAGTDRLRKVINKGLDRESFLQIVEKVCEKGWRTLKFYFMIGLPTETDEDLEGIVALVHDAKDIGWRRWKGQLKINVSLSPFVPKPHTPFQWFGQVSLEEMERRYEFVAERLRDRSVSIKRHDPRLSWIEAVIARGDRRLSRVIKRAWQRGAKLDGWKEYFRFDAWVEAFREEGINPAFYANRERGESEPFPWDHVGTRLGRAFLWKQWQLALRGQEVPDCSTTSCVGCDVCDGQIDHQMADEVWKAPVGLVKAGKDSGNAGSQDDFRRSKTGEKHYRLTPRASLPSEEVESRESPPADFKPKKGKPQPPRKDSAPPVQRLRFRYSRRGDLKFLAHLDVMKILQMACVRGRLNPSYSEGFHPTLRLQLLPPLPLGFQSLDEVCDLMVTQAIDPQEARNRLNEALPEGMKVHHAEALPVRLEAPEACLVRSDFRVEIPPDVAEAKGLTGASVAEAIHAFRASDAFPYVIPPRGKRSSRLVNLKETVLELGEPEWSEAGGVSVVLAISHEAGKYADPLSCLTGVLSASLSFADGVDATRTAAHLRPSTK